MIYNLELTLTHTEPRDTGSNCRHLFEGTGLMQNQEVFDLFLARSTNPISTNETANFELSSKLML